jgi:hypothetical protein
MTELSFEELFEKIFQEVEDGRRNAIEGEALRIFLWRVDFELVELHAKINRLERELRIEQEDRLQAQTELFWGP